MCLSVNGNGDYACVWYTGLFGTAAILNGVTACAVGDTVGNSPSGMTIVHVYPRVALSERSENTVSILVHVLLESAVGERKEAALLLSPEVPLVSLFCIADWNRDDGVDDADIFAFLNDFELGNGDANCDGSNDDLDISAFFAAFETGC